MREIKFRLWDKEIKKMKTPLSPVWFEENYWNDDNFANCAERCGCILMQFTGMIDKHGKEVYEGDILRFDVMTDYGLLQMLGKMEWNNSLFQFGVSATSPLESMPPHVVIKESEMGRPEVIGNVYENPEILA